MIKNKQEYNLNKTFPIVSLCSVDIIFSSRLDGVLFLPAWGARGEGTFS